MKPFATLGSEISKVRDRVRRGAEALRPAKVANDVRDQRDRLLAKLGEQTFRLIAERKLQVPKVLQDSVEKLAALLGVQLPAPDASSPEPGHEPAPAPAPETRHEENARRERDATHAASFPFDEPAEVDEPSVGDTSEASVPPPRAAQPASEPAPTPAKPAGSSKKKPPPQKRGSKKRSKR